MADNNGTPTVTLHLDRPRHLKMTLGTLQRLKQKNVQLSELERLDGADTITVAIEQLPVILWAMMAHEDPDLTPEVVADLLDLGKLEEAAAAIKEVLSLSVPKGAANPPPARARSAGARAKK